MLKERKKLIWDGPLYDGSGYSFAALGYIKAMESDFDVKIMNRYYSLVDKKKYMTPEDIKYVADREIKSYVLNEDNIYIKHATPNALTSFRKNTAIAYTVWETLGGDYKYLINCDNFNFILTPSEWSKNCLIDGGVKKPIYVLPHIVEKRELPKNDLLKKVTDNYKFIFLSIFEWHLGKGYDTLLKGYIESFRNNPDTLLILKVNSFVNKGLKGEVNSYIKKLKGDSKYPSILVIANPITTDVLYSLYKYSDVFVLPTRREGFSLPIADALVHDMPVIVPNIGGHKEYVNDDCGFLINSILDKIKFVEPERSNYLGQYWVESDLNDFIKKLKLMYSNWPNRSKEDNDSFLKATAKIRDDLSANTIIDRFKSILFNEGILD